MKKITMTFQQKSKPSVKAIWKAAGKPISLTVTSIEKTRQPWEYPYWEIHYEIE